MNAVQAFKVVYEVWRQTLTMQMRRKPIAVV